MRCPRASLVSFVVLAACGPSRPTPSPTPSSKPVAKPIVACPEKVDAAAIDALKKRHAAAFGSVESVAASLPRSFAFDVTSGGTKGTFEFVIDAKRHRTSTKLGVTQQEDGIDDDGPWALNATDVVVRLHGIEAMAPNAFAWIARRRYLTDVPARGTCMPDEHPTMRLVYENDELGSPELDFDLETAALLAIFRDTPEGSKEATAYRAWSKPDARGVRWPTETNDASLTSASKSTATRDEAGLHCARGGKSIASDSCLAPSTPSFAIAWPPSGRVRVPMEFFMNEVLLTTRVGGRDVRAFLDSGAGITVIDATTKLGASFKPKGEQEGASATQKIMLGFGELPTVSVGELSFSHLPVASVPIPALDDAGEKRPEIILGYSLFEAMAIRVDYAKREVIFAKDGKGLANASATAIPMRHIDGKLVVDAKFESHDARYVIDTGNTGGFDLYMRYATKNSVLEKRPTASLTGKFSAGTEETTQIVFRHQTVTFGPITSTGGLTRVDDPPSTSDVAGLLGNAALARCPAIVFDFVRRTFYLEGPCTRDVPESRSGWHLTKRVDTTDANAKDRPWVIRNVIPGGAADKAGLRKDDRILEIAKKPATLDVEKIAALVAQPSGTKLEVVYLREGKKATVTLVLADILRP